MAKTTLRWQTTLSARWAAKNIVAVTHCMTRLRFVLKDENLTDVARLKSISGVLGVVRNDNQCGDYWQHGFTGVPRSSEPAAR